MGFFTGAAGGIVSGIANLIGGNAANEANAKEAANSRNLQYHMSNTAHQREVQDLRKAGLNPILSATGGSGASTGSGAQAKIENVMGPAVTSAMDAMSLAKDISLAGTQENLNAANEASARMTAIREGQTAKQIERQNKMFDAIFGDKVDQERAKGGEARDYIDNQQFYNLMKKAGSVTQVGADAMDIFTSLMSRGKIKIPRGSTLLKNKTGEILRERNW